LRIVHAGRDETGGFELEAVDRVQIDAISQDVRDVKHAFRRRDDNIAEGRNARCRLYNASTVYPQRSRAAA
jgi:hypothetical protein